MIIRRALSRLSALFQKRSLDRELESEIEAHLEMAERDALAAGLPPGEARTAALRRFGGIEQVKEQHRERRGFAVLENLFRDLRYGLAAVSREPGFSAIVAGVLALGIGANIAMFSLVDAVLLKPLPFREPDRIVRVWEAPRPGVTNATSTLDFLDWKRLGTVFDALAAEIPIYVSMTGGGEPVRLAGKAVTADYFRVFGAKALLGRTFGEREDQPGAAPVVVLSHAAWQTNFGGDPGILSRQVVLDGETYQVVGVLPPGAFDRDEARLWKPLVFTPDRYLREIHWLLVHGRLRDGASVAQAREQMRSIHAALAPVTPLFKRDWTIEVQQLGILMVGDNLRRSISVAFGAVALVLLIACANVTNLLLAKGSARKKEIAIRTALGASRGRLIAQLLTESLVLFLIGGAAGLGLAFLLIRAATPFLAQSIPYTASLALDYRAFAFAAAVVIGSGLLVGTIPAIETSVGNLGNSLRQAGRGASKAHHGIRRLIVVTEVAVSLLLVCGALLLFRSLSNLQRLETGIRIENVITVSMNLPEQGYATPDKAAAFYDALSERVKAVPGVAQAGLTTYLPLRWITNGEAIEAPGVKGRVNVRFKRVDPGYFATFGIPLIAGRGVTERDRDGARRVIVINQALAARLAEIAGMKNPVGRSVSLYYTRYNNGGTDIRDVEIVGVIRGERVGRPGMPDPAVVYVPLAQAPHTDFHIVVRTQAAPALVIAGIRDGVRGIDPNLPLGDVETMQEVRDKTLSGASRPAWLIGVFACVAALLAAIGLYGVLSQAVAQRRREIGIRMALGAQASAVVSGVLRNALMMIAAGLAVGMCGAFALTRVLKSLLFGVSPLDPLSLAAACASMMLIGLFAGFVPASRAAKVDPAATLRDES